MHPVIHAYKLRLTNLSQGNRSLKLAALSPRKDMDITAAGFLNKLSSEEILSRIVAGKPVELIRALNPRDEATNLLDRRLNHVFREISTLYEETGAYDLFLGYPFVEGRFLDGSIARCPVVLFPVRLERDFEGSPRWRLTVPENEAVTFNKTFFLAFEKFMQMRLPAAFWEVELEHQETLQDLLNQLYALFQSFELPLNFNSNLFQFKVTPFENKNAARLEQLPIGQLKFQPHAVLGIFPQSDSALLQDYEQIERESQLFNVQNVLSVQAATKAASTVKEDERFLVTAVDQSQEEALMQVRAGNSIVLHGPPGTGKSQVILNLIADALAHGQRVLVCSQKRAALDVVYQRLAELGLGSFAALVHDFRGDRNKIFQHIAQQVDLLDDYRKAAADVSLDKWQRDFRLDARRIDELNRFFEDLQLALTKPSRFGLNAHQLYLLADPRQPALPIQPVGGRLDYAALRQLVERFADLQGYLPLFQPAHPWRQRVSMHPLGLGAKSSLMDRLAGLRAEIQGLHQAWVPLAALQLSPQDIPGIQQCIDRWKEMAAHFQAETTRIDFAHFQQDSLSPSAVRKTLERLRKLITQIGAFQILDDFSLHLFDDLKQRVLAYKNGLGKVGRFFSLDWLKGRWYVNRILKRKQKSLNTEGWKAFQKEYDILARFMEAWQEANERAFFKDMPLLDGPATLLQWCQRKHTSLEAVSAARDYKGPKPLQVRSGAKGFDHAHWKQASDSIQALSDYLPGLQASLLRWRAWLHEQQIAPLLQGIALPENAEAAISSLIDSLARDFELLRDLDGFLHSWTAPERDCLALLQDEIGKPRDAQAFQAWLPHLENSFYLHWIGVLEAESPILTETSSPRMDATRQAYLDKVKARQESAVALIRCKLQDHILAVEAFNRLGNPVTYREIARQVRKQRRIWPMRKLVSEFWEDGLARLMPCWLASPESVAAIFPMAPHFFDLVIFDEASQCYVERALPVILRGKTTIVAGDDKQLQPFDLYNVKVEDTEAAFLENEMAMEVESVLDLARNIYPECKLMWHYRSREEELIQFSNHVFYEGRLNIMPPAFPDHLFQPPLEFLRVEGLWEKHQNRVEAEAVLDLVERLVQRPDHPSIGIVTFNHPQMELIRDLLDQRLDSLAMSFNPELRGLMHKAMEQGDGEARQGLFVKNIENVQGDERDIIIFSVGYAKNAAGKLMANFGLLNQRGGENRLNVAITRARRKVYVICSFDPLQLEVADAAHEGPRLLKRYLAYARDVSAGTQTALASQKPQAETMAVAGKSGAEIAERLAKRLRARGLEIDMQVGATAFKVDLAVRDGKGGYRLGIECEGSVYFSGKSGKEREVYRRRLLEANGWRLHRVWARSFFLNPDGVVEEVLAKLGR